MKRFSGLLAVALVGCASEAEKLARLDSDRTISCLVAQKAESELNRNYDSIGQAFFDSVRLEAVKLREGGQVARADSLDAERVAAIKTLGIDTLLTQWKRTKAECELATRRYEGFGR